MATRGWTTDTEADIFFSTHIGLLDFWAGLSPAQKIAALTTSFNKLSHSVELSLPSSPTVAQLVDLAYAQHEYAGILAILSEGGARREALISQGVVNAGVVKEAYDMTRAGKLPKPITGILDGFKTERIIYMYDAYRNEDDNPAFDAVFPRRE